MGDHTEVMLKTCTQKLLRNPSYSRLIESIGEIAKRTLNLAIDNWVKVFPTRRSKESFMNFQVSISSLEFWEKSYKERSKTHKKYQKWKTNKDA